MSSLHLARTDLATDRAAIFGVRRAVFVVEQRIPADLEIDDFDAAATHVLAWLDGRPVATGRITAAGRIGRMAVLQEHRRRGIGAAILELLLEIARETGLERVGLSAQCQAQAFYTAAGFRAIGPVYEEAGLDHQWMERKLERG